MPNPPVRFSSAVETLKPDEKQTIAQIDEAFDEILETTAENYGHAVRSVHAKAHGVLEGVLTIDDCLRPELAQGLFAKPGTHRVFMRISTNAGDILPDAISLPRGLAIKVIGVEGERLPGAEGRCQDFVLINGTVFQTRTAEEFLSNLNMLAKTTDRMEGAKKATSTVLRGINTALESVGVQSTKILALGGAPNVDPLGETYYSVTPFRYGDYIAKFSLAPVSQSLTSLAGSIVDARGKPDAIRDTLRDEMHGLDGQWEFRVQLCRDLERQPIEDPTVEWSEEDAPFERVGTISVRAQDSWDERRVDAVDEKMRFSVWTGLAAHQPLGNINRARQQAYRHSASFRERFNRCPIHEPDDASQT